MAAPSASAAVELAARRFGEGPPAFVLHGLLGQGRNWQAIARRLATTRSLWLPDLRNHGASPRALPMTYPAMVDDLRAMADREGLPRVSLVGHSMGGKVAMAMALSMPERVDRLVVVDVAPIAYRHSTFQHYLAAMLDLDLAALGRRTAVEAALADVDPDPRVRAFLTSNLDVTTDGPRWLPALDVLLESLPSILDFPADLAARTFDGPTLFVCGANSDYLRPQDEPIVRRLFPQARIERVDGAGHWVHADRPDVVMTALGDFLPSL